MLDGVKGELIDVGKNAGRHKLKQEEINQLLVKKAEEGKIVVRLKGGDPISLWQGGRRSDHLRERGIPFEVVPGVTSASRRPGAGGNSRHPESERWHRLLPLSPAMRSRERISPLDWQAIARVDGTLVVLMGVSRLEENTRALMDTRKTPSDPRCHGGEGRLARAEADRWNYWGYCRSSKKREGGVSCHTGGG